MLQYPERKKYRDIVNDMYVVEYEQASLEETQDYIKMLEDPKLNEDLLAYIDQWVQDNVKIKKELLQASSKQDVEMMRRQIKVFATKIRQTVEPKLHKVVKSIYDGVVLPKTKDPRPVFLDSRLLYVVEHSLIPLDKVTQTITFEQFQWFCDKMTYEYLESFKPGKLINDKIKRARGLTPEQEKMKELYLAHSSYSDNGSSGQSGGQTGNDTRQG